MFQFLIPILLATTLVQSQHSGLYYPQESAASDAQIRFAIENKYDDTGPGAKRPEFAYNTFKTLEEALVGYIDDPDTKLPEFEKAKGIRQLYENQNRDMGLFKINPLQSLKRPQLIKNSPLLQHPTLLPSQQSEAFSFIPEQQQSRLEQLKIHKFQPVKGNPLNLAHFTRDPDLNTNKLNANPSYTYSYGVHDKLTGDSKSAHESRDGDQVTGFYTFIDPDGKQRTVHYTANDKQGFRAIVRRTVTNSQ
ncbi:hypothetical protein evm_000682 [Chilo suppressalis]|nr:hypothetical protein evm_000682 [Chilo suppressalis]